MTSDQLADTIHKARPSHTRRWVGIIVVLAIAGGGYYWYRKQQDGKNVGPVYETKELSRGDIQLTVTATGNLKPTNQVTVGSELSGTALEVYVDNNDTVTKGQELAKLDTSKLLQTIERSKAVVLAAEARVAQVNATLLENQASLDRYRELHKLSGGKTPSKADMDTAVAAVDRATADLKSAEASVAQGKADLASNERDLSKAIIRSPVDGTVLTRSLEPGQTVAASFQAPQLFIIAEDLSKMELAVSVAEADIGRVEKGQNASFSVDAWPTRSFSALVTKVLFGSTVTDNVVTYSTELEVPNDDLSLRPGMTATADIAVAKAENVFMIPNAALRFDPNRNTAAPEEPKKTLVQSLAPTPGRRFGRGGGGGGGGPRPGEEEDRGKKKKDQVGHVWVLREGKPHQITVTTGITDGRMTEATSDELTEGMEIITSSRPANAS